MSFKFARLGAGDWLMFVGAAGLIVDLFANRWFSYPNGFYGYTPGLSTAAVAADLSRGQDGWQALPVLGPIAALVAAAAILTFGAQALRRSPAVPIVLTTLLAPIAALLLIALAVRTLIAPPSFALRHIGGGSRLGRDAGAYIGVGFSLLLAVGPFVSLRREGILPSDGPGEIETIRLDDPATQDLSR
jgi:phosphoglycerol transferase MdoB-like AlkP superfamily enzyme